MSVISRLNESLWRHDQRFVENRWQQIGLLAYAICWGLLAMEPYSVFNWWLENLLIIAAAAGLVSTYRYFKFNNFSYVLILLFITLHTVGAHYSYNTTPLDRWLNAIFHYERDHYDRIVHFSFGLLIAYPAHEIMIRVVKLRRGWSCVLVPCLILAFGAFYELIEMWVALIVSPEEGALFLGSQGDPWDAHHDMELALYGAIIAMMVTAIGGRRKVRR